MSEENAEMNQDDITDDWAAAMAEQTEAEAAVNDEKKEAANDELRDEPEVKNEKYEKASFNDLDGEAANDCSEPNLDVILDIPVTLSMEIGSTEISINNLLQLNQGSVVELDRLAGEPMDVLVNGTLIAHGEVVVVNEKFGIRLTDVISPAERVKKLR